MQDKKFIYSITTGRSGSAYLTRLLEQNACDSTIYHERTGWQMFGEVTPDLSHAMLYNSVGNVERVKAFWDKKFRFDSSHDQPTYIETSHLLSKAGLCENLPKLATQASKIHLIVLKRDIFKIAWSLFNRHDFANAGATWIFYLDPRAPNTILNSDAFIDYGQIGCALWYVYEIFTRAEYYKLLLAPEKNIIFHDVYLEDLARPDGAIKLLNALDFYTTEATLKIPSKANQQDVFPYAGQEAQLLELIKKFTFDPSALAKKFYDAGNRLGNGAVQESIFD